MSHIECGDGVHPTMATKVAYGWIRKGTNKPIDTTGSRTPMNLFDSINLESMRVTIGVYETIDSAAMEEHFKKLRKKYPKSKKNSPHFRKGFCGEIWGYFRLFVSIQPKP